MFSPKPNSILKSVAGLCFLASGTLMLSACNDDTAQQNSAVKQTTASLPVQVSYLDRSLLAPNSQLTVTLVDVSKMDVAATVISEQVIDLVGAPPYKVELEYNLEKIDPAHRYSVRATINNQGNLLYTSTTSNSPFANTASSEPLEIIVSKVAPKPDVDLVNTYFKAVSIDGNLVEVNTKEPFIQFNSDNTVHGFLGCNNFNGGYEVSKQTVTFTQLATTQKMCHENMEQESAMAGVLQAATQWQINGEKLVLQNEAGKQLATFNAVYF
ncbi:MAG: META domain-containing protein [Pseudomonadota bacterium]